MDVSRLAGRGNGNVAEPPGRPQKPRVGRGFVAITAVGVALVFVFAKKPAPATPERTVSDRASAQQSASDPPAGPSAENSTHSLPEDAAAGNSGFGETPAKTSIHSVSLTETKPIIPAADKIAANQSCRAQLVGTWEQNDHGKRLLTVRADGTATIEVRPEALWRLLFGRRLEIEIEWTIEQNSLAFHTVGGKPAAQVKLVNEMYGDQRVYQIENMSTDELILLDEEGERCQPWQRIDADTVGSFPQDRSAGEASAAARRKGEMKAARGSLSYH